MDYKFPGDESLQVKDAEILGFGSSRKPEKDRWSEVTIVGGECTYFVCITGKSTVPNEVDFHTALIFRTARDLVRGLSRRKDVGEGSYLPAYAREALKAAAELDLDVEGALAKYDEAVAWIGG